MSLRAILVSASILLTQVSYASTQWLRVGVGERRCATTCGRVGMDNVLTAKSDTIARSICATHLPESTKMLAGSQSLAGDESCAIAGADKNATNYYCLCADDGVANGADISWVDSQHPGRCDLTCKSLGPKKYGYAVYASYVQESWAHVCAPKNGSIGITGGGRMGCQTASGTADSFQCLCTRGFSGDLEPTLDP